MKSGSGKEVLRVAWPLIISTASFSVMQFCDRAFLAHYSGDALRAVVPSGILAFTLICGFRALVAYSNTFVAQYYGAGEHKLCSLATMQGVILSFLLWPVILTLIPLGRGLLMLANHSPPVLADELNYFTLIMLGSITNILGIAAASFFIGRGKTIFLMTVLIFANSLNVALDYALIFGKWGFPSLGIRGAAIGTVVSGSTIPLLLLTLFFSKACDRKFATRAAVKFKFGMMKRMIRFALPSGISFAIHIGSFAFFVVMVGRLGPVALAASNIALSVNLFAFMPMIGLGLAAQTLTGQYLGAKDPDSAARAVFSSLKIGVVYIILIGITFVLMPHQYIALFTGSGDSVIHSDQVFECVRILMLFLVVRGLADIVDIILSSALKGAGDTKFVMIFSVATAWLMLGVGEYLIIEVFKSNIYVAWGWSILYLIVTATGYALRFHAGNWRNIDLMGIELPEPLSADIEAISAIE